MLKDICLFRMNTWKYILDHLILRLALLKENIEWNVKLTKKHSEPFVQEILKDYNQLWEMAGSSNGRITNKAIRKLTNALNSLKMKI